MPYTSFDEIEQIHTDLHKTFKTKLTLPLAFRQHQALQLARMLKENHARIADAIWQDLGKPAFEVYLCEINPIMERCVLTAQRLPGWTQVENREDIVSKPHQKQWKPRVYKAPKGVGVVIAPWNYPVVLSFQPLLGAIAAGCCCVLKLSEVSSHFAEAVADIFPRYLDQRAYRVVLGGVPEVTRLLELKWNHIFYTGNGTVARVISAAAAKHLTPVTLELGGKSPVIIDPDFDDIELAAKRIFWGKTSNSGQICVSPDYVLVPTKSRPGLMEELVKGFQKAYKESFPEGSPALESESYAHIINELHYRRVERLLEETKGKVVTGGGKDPKTFKMEPTILTGITPEDALMQGENFGPVLPLLEVDTVDDAIEFISSRNHPLVMYVFSDNEEVKTRIREGTASGALIFNDTFIQLDVNEMPFGGVGESGHGSQVLQYTFEEFSYKRSCLTIPKEIEPVFKTRYPPYSQETFDLMCKPGTALEIPESTPENGLKA
ncbi:aldehyde dehydrogenase [Dendrothele bispora CBS 962.96]|uniref:Aldehyde dehydrogenase n=1 Tax=Dendrothele bispora (strain CBS 962.96) TaxID=1314807 RepID=A0A4S8LPK9_DENBC|nr:aldehyde dehydrogenase [Dendrothele bispora CBS 962.96]